MIDPSIPLRAETINLADIMEQSQAMRMRQMQMEEYERKRRQEAEKGESLAALIADPNGMRRDNPNFQRYAQADPSNAFQLIERMDKAEREKVEAGLKDLSAAVQWARTPEQWRVVQQHVAQFDPQAAQTPFEQREQVLIQLGQMGEYLKNTAPKIMSIEAGGSLAAVDPRTGQPTFTVLPNPGDAAPGAPAASGGQSGALPRVTSPQEALRLPPGSRFVLPDGRIGTVPGGGGGGNVTSNFLDGL